MTLRWVESALLGIHLRCRTVFQYLSHQTAQACLATNAPHVMVIGEQVLVARSVRIVPLRPMSTTISLLMPNNDMLGNTVKYLVKLLLLVSLANT